ncbi:MAG: ATP-binding protein [Candidatus Woesearchaeota archaeon]|jgi:signal transduction histidine kinase/ligand-binding sensor protein
MYDKYDNTFRKLLHVFLVEVLKDFQRFIIEKFEMPSSLWIYDEYGELQYIEPKESLSKYSKFCSYMIMVKSVDKKYSKCVEIEKENIHFFLKEMSAGSCCNKSDELVCHMGISKMVYPLEVEGVIVGALILGKFLKESSSHIVLMQNCNDFCDNYAKDINKIKTTEKINFKQNLINSLDNIKIIDDTIIQEISKRIHLLLPLLRRLYRYNYPQNHLFDGVLFLEKIDNCFNEIIRSENDMWQRLGCALEHIITKLNLNSSAVFFSDRDNYQDLKLCQKKPTNVIFPKSLQLNSSYDFQLLASRNTGLILPTKDEHLFWLNDQINKIFTSNAAIIYAQRVFAGKMIIISFAFKDNVFLTEFQRLLLKESTNRLFKQINNVLSSIEIDHLMADTGHMLRRAIEDIEKGLAAIQKHGLIINETDPAPLKIIKEIAPKSIDSGLFKIKLIMRNFHAFKSFRKYQYTSLGDDSSIISHLQEIDLIKLIKDVSSNYYHEFQKHDKKINFNSSMDHLHYIGHASLFELMFLNLIDNASKFSYDGTYIDISIEIIDGFYVLIFSNLGVGVARDEFKIVFDRYYQSRFKSESKRREGSGYGLNICKRYMDIFIPKGSISLTSRQARIVKKKKSFEGHNFITTVTLKLPIDQKELSSNN